MLDLPARVYLLRVQLSYCLPRTYALTACCATANTSRADVVPATCSVPVIPRSIHPALTLSNISSAGPVWPFGMPNCSNASAHPCTRDRKGFDVEFQYFTQLSGHFIRAYHRTELDDAMP